MNGVHDCGGAHNQGPIVRPENEPVFAAPWEARVVGTMMGLFFGGFANSDEARSSIEQMRPAAYLTAPYYAKWLYFLQNLLIEKGVVTADEIAEGKVLTSGYDGDPGITKVKLGESFSHFQRGGSIAMPAEIPARFKVGDKVVARNVHPHHHTRKPRYVAGKKGTVVADRGSFGFSDTRAHGRGDRAQQLYSVRFEGEEVWGDSAETNQAIYLDMYDEYLEPVASS